MALRLLRNFSVVAIALAFHLLAAVAQQPVERLTNDEIAKQLANPNTPLATLRLKNLFNFYGGSLPGAGDQWNYSMLFQPSFPFPVGDEGDLFLWRPALPILFETPVFNATSGEFDKKTGLGDIGMDFAYAKTSEGGLLTALGFITTVPTATNRLGKEQWLLGPEILIGKITETSVIGLFPNHQWDIAGEDSFDTSITSIQAFATFLPGGGWSVGSAPIMTYDWEASQWSIPLNFTVSKTAQFAGKPWKFDLTLDYYVEQNDAFGPEWIVGFNMAPVVENVLAGIFDR